MKTLDKEGFLRILSGLETNGGYAVFPLPIHPDDWWSGPHLNHATEFKGLPFREWFPARCEYLDGANPSEAYFVLGTPDGKYITIDLNKNQINDVAVNFTWEDLTQDVDCYGKLDSAKFFEAAGYYNQPEDKSDKDKSKLRIVMHRGKIPEDMAKSIEIWTDEYFGITPEMKQRLKEFEESIYL